MINYDKYVNNVMEGSLQKADEKNNWGFSFGWQTKWFKLSDCRLFFYTKKPTQNSKGVIHEGVISTQLCSSIEKIGETGFTIHFPERDFSLMASSKQIRDDWIKAIEEAKDIYEKLEKHVENNKKSSTGSIARKSEPRKEGYVDVCYFLGWNKMYFVLVDGMLLVFNSKGGSRKHKIPLYGSRVEEEPSSSSRDRIAFTIHSPEATKKELLCSCSTVEDTQLWITAMLKHKLLIEEVINSVKL